MWTYLISLCKFKLSSYATLQAAAGRDEVYGSIWGFVEQVCGAVVEI